VSLSGFSFATDGLKYVTLGGKWSHYSGYGGYWESARYACARGITVVQGLLRNDDSSSRWKPGNALATLSEPSSRLGEIAREDASVSQTMRRLLGSVSSSSFATALDPLELEPVNDNSSTLAQLGFASSVSLQDVDDARYVLDVPDNRRSASSVFANDARCASKWSEMICTVP
jgi:hypothetical protein